VHFVHGQFCSHLQALTRVIVHAVSAFQQVTLVESCLLKNVFVQTGFQKVDTKPNTDIPICVVCPVGMFWTEERCIQCPDHTITAASGTLSVSECLCVAGYMLQGDKCKLCPADTYQAILGGSCTTCPSNAMSAAGSSLQTDCLCKHGFK
jgi:hypothetical protein